MFISKFLLFFLIFLWSISIILSISLITGGYRPEKHFLEKHLVSIRVFRPLVTHGDNHICGGAIIAPAKILTVAHCIWTSELQYPPEALTVVAGNKYRLKGTNQTQTSKVTSVLIHPEYQEDPVIADVAILTLDNPIEIDGITTKTVPLAIDRPRVYAECTVMGWGRVHTNGPIPDEVLFVDLYIWDENSCSHVYSDQNQCMFCAADYTDAAKGACVGDSGGPLICKGELAGILSFGKECGHLEAHADFYTDLSCYRSWILTNNAKNLKASLKFIEIIFYQYFIIFYGKYTN